MKTAAEPRSLARPEFVMLGADAIHHRLHGGVEHLDDHHQPADADEQQDLVEESPIQNASGISSRMSSS
jgi:hypothetical protein